MSKDSLVRFLFDNQDVRGAWVSLDQSMLDILKNQPDYPSAVRDNLVQCIAASTLLSTVIKFEGLLSLQARGQGDLQLLMAETTHNLDIRGIARMASSGKSIEKIGEKNKQSLTSLLGSGHLVVSIEPTNGQNYQGYVPLNGVNLAECLQYYFQQSEQLDTYFHIANDGAKVTALMLQRLPVADAKDSGLKQKAENFWEHCMQLVHTLGDEELLSNDYQTILHRLFHDETTRVYDPQTIRFKCRCSRERTEKALRSIGQEEVESLIKEDGEIRVDCEFCGTDYVFDEQQALALFDPPVIGGEQ